MILLAWKSSFVIAVAALPHGFGSQERYTHIHKVTSGLGWGKA